MRGSITPENVHLTLFGIIAGPFIALVIIEVLSGRCLSHQGFHRIYSRTEDPGGFWFNVSQPLPLLVSSLGSAWANLLNHNALTIP